MTPITLSKRFHKEHARSTEPCKCCGHQLTFAASCYVVYVRASGRTFSPFICSSCGRKDDLTLMDGLVEQARKTIVREDIFITDYVRIMAAQEI